MVSFPASSRKFSNSPGEFVNSPGEFRKKIFFQIRHGEFDFFSEMKETQRACSEVPSRWMKFAFHLYS